MMHVNMMMNMHVILLGVRMIVLLAFSYSVNEKNNNESVTVCPLLCI
jgi:hypothetical protein